MEDVEILFHCFGSVKRILNSLNGLFCVKLFRIRICEEGFRILDRIVERAVIRILQDELYALKRYNRIVYLLLLCNIILSGYNCLGGLDGIAQRSFRSLGILVACVIQRILSSLMASLSAL